MKKAILLVSLFVGIQVSAVEFTDIIRNPDGSTLQANWSEANQACINLGLRLPTGREAGEYSIQHGSKGFTESDEVNFGPIVAENPDGSIERFYFNSKGYRNPHGQYTLFVFWTSSRYITNPDLKNRYISFVEDFGSIGYGHRDSILNVRCVKE